MLKSVDLKTSLVFSWENAASSKSIKVANFICRKGWFRGSIPSRCCVHTYGEHDGWRCMGIKSSNSMECWWFDFDVLGIITAAVTIVVLTIPQGLTSVINYSCLFYEPIVLFSFNANFSSVSSSGLRASSKETKRARPELVCGLELGRSQLSSVVASWLLGWYKYKKDQVIVTEIQDHMFLYGSINNVTAFDL